MSKIIDLVDLQSYHNELASHIQLLTRDTSYSVGDIVQYDGRYFKCTTAGNTDTTRPDFSTTGPYTDGTVEWTEFNQNNQIYELGKSYSVNDLVVYNDKWYKCITDHTATSTFDTTKWAEVSASENGISEWQASTEYEVGDVLIYNNFIYRCDTAHTSTSTFDDTKFVQLTHELEEDIDLVEDIFGGAGV